MYMLIGHVQMCFIRNILHLFLNTASDKCRIPEYLHGKWIYLDNGITFNIIITAYRWEINHNRIYDRTELMCEELYVHPNQNYQGDGGNNVTMIMSTRYVI